ncbi:uncharacterized protein LOC124255972 [Haliotis rubra]|uniref:uncharacterized protein LOC124255972 n=1 Tax=Haliotis rubra TaxID=36100 RepID=UPI001EE5DD1F|nr:uncharacterized protein LOC124255972 [Haliotis rubra]
MNDVKSFESYQDDVTFLKTCLYFINKEMDIELMAKQEGKTMLQYLKHMDNGNQARVVFPQGMSVVQEYREGAKTGDSVLYFVGFIGEKLDTVDEHVVQQIWQMDAVLVAELNSQEDILVYCSAERSPGGNWGNLVLLRHPRAIQKWNQLKIHDHAIRDISPAYYTSIRIHRGVLPQGLASDRFTIERTLFLNYDNINRRVQRRHIETWQSTLTDTATSTRYA